MARFLVSLVVTAVGLWLTTLLLSPHVRVDPYEDNELAAVLTYLLVALIFGIVNGVVGTVVRIVAFPLYILTLGLISFIVNGLLLLLTAFISQAFGFGLEIEGFWWGVLGALVLAIISGILGLFLRPLLRASRERR